MTPERLKVLLLTLFLFLSGCISEGATPIGGSGGGGELKIVHLEDGTKCVVLVGYKKAALDCDFGEDNEK